MAKPSQSTDHMNNSAGDPNFSMRDPKVTKDTTAGLFQGPDMTAFEQNQYLNTNPQPKDRNFP